MQLMVRPRVIPPAFRRACPLDLWTGPTPSCAWGTFAWSSRFIGQQALTTNDGSATTYDMGRKGFVVGTFTGQRVSKLFPQVGSAALEQTTLASRPTVWQSARDSWPEIRFHSRYGTSGSKLFSVTSAPTARSGRDWTCVWVQRSDPQTYQSSGSVGWAQCVVDHSLGGSGNVFGNTQSINPATPTWVNYRIFNGSGGWTDVTQPVYRTDKYSVHIMRHNASGTTLFVDGVKVAVGGTLTSSNVTPDAVGQLNAFGIYTDCANYLGGAWFPDLTDAQCQLMTRLLHGFLHGGVTPRSIWVFDGDSITAGYSAADGNRDMRELAWPQTLVSSLPAYKRKLLTVTNTGHTAAHLETTASSEHKLPLNQSLKVNSMLGSGTGYRHRVVFLSAGTNDIVYGGSVANILTAIATYKTSAESAGATKVFILTQIPRQGLTAGQETDRQSLNSSIISTYGAQAIDVASQNWQPGGGSDWSTCYQDGIHPNAAGRALYRNAVKPYVAHLI